MSNPSNVDTPAPADPDEWFGAFDEAALNKPTSSGLNTHILATAILSLAFVFALLLFLHLYIRYVLLRRRRSSSHYNHRPSAAAAAALHIDFAATANVEPPKPGLDPSAIAALPSFPYAKKEAASLADCAVCLSAVEEGETVRRLPGCGHVFHVKCIDVWLEANSSCPVCRAGVEPPLATAAAADVTVTGEAAIGGKEEAVGSVSGRLSSSLRRMLSRERSGRRVAVTTTAADIAVEADLERQQ